MGVQYRVFEEVVLVASSEILVRLFLSDSKTLRSEFVSFASRAKGSCGNDPGPEWLRIVTLSVSSMGDWLDGVRKRLVGV
jgi:hypothetical protein